MSGRPVALVTGASRGIGKASALALATAGFDVALTARTLREGQGRDDSDVGSDRLVPGSLESTAAEVIKRGGDALPVVADLLDRPALVAAVRRVLDEWGRVDVLVNNAVHTGPGSMVAFHEMSVEQLETKLAANTVAQVVLTKAVLPAMLAAGGGTVVNMTSFSAYNDPRAPVGSGGWGFAYAASKAGFHRMAGILAVELGDRGIRAYNLDPGHVVTERMAANAARLGLAGHYHATPPSVPAAVVAWLATSADAAKLNGQTIAGPRFALEHSLHPDWR